MTVGDDDVTAAFAAALHVDARDRFADQAALARQLASGHAAASADHPDLAIAPARFASELARRLGSAATPEVLAQLRFADVYLAIGCHDGDERAIAACTAAVQPQIEHAGRHVRATPDQVAEVRARIQRILFVDEPPRAAAASEFAGRGDLRGYVRVIATRELIRLVNRERREVRVDDETMFDALVPAGDPALSMMRERYRGDVDQAMRAALVSLDDRARALLRYSMIDGWSIDRIGKLYGVHRATAARWITEARDQLGERIREVLAERLEISVDDVNSIIRLVQSRVDMSLERLL
ncbi:MAG: helix-turn-helix domain-containing protein [Kofleriaceae bacterium]